MSYVHWRIESYEVEPDWRSAKSDLKVTLCGDVYNVGVPKSMTEIFTELCDKINRDDKGIPPITNVIFNDPATIVFWADKTKTVVKCEENDIYDPEKGLAMAIVKKMLGNQGNYYNTIKKWLPEEKPKLAEHEFTTYIKRMFGLPGDFRLREEKDET